MVAECSDRKYNMQICLENDKEGKVEVKQSKFNQSTLNHVYKIKCLIFQDMHK